MTPCDLSYSSHLCEFVVSVYCALNHVYGTSSYPAKDFHDYILTFSIVHCFAGVFPISFHVVAVWVSFLSVIHVNSLIL